MSRKNNVFTTVPSQKVNRNLFDLSHEVKMSGKFGYIYPVLLMDCLPGDTVRDTTNVFIRFAPMLAPVMHRCDVTTHFFYVPNRLLSNHWQDFITGGQDGTAEPVLPYVTPNGLRAAAGNSPEPMQPGSLWDYMGLPTYEGIPASINSLERVSALPFRACAKVWNDYYRDPNFDDEMELELDRQGDVSAYMWGGGLLGPGIMDIKKYRRMWEKDYFTSALPWAQRGAQVLMPLAGSATPSYYDVSEVKDEFGNQVTTNTIDASVGLLYDPSGPNNLRIENIGNIEFDNPTSTINDLRRAMAIQRWLENNARGGARYIEQIQSHFNVTVPDYRLQRAEYLGGGRQPVQISEVLSTADTTEVPVGDMAGHGMSVGRTNSFTYRCQEHGFVVGFISITMRPAYQQGIPRLFSRVSKYDYAWPELAHIGEQEILNKELYFSFDEVQTPTNNSGFGYIPRYSEYKFMNDRVAGDFRTTLDIWHLGRIFTSRPLLNEVFTTIYEEGFTGPDPISPEESYRRIFAVQDGTDYLWMQLYHRLTAKRPLPYFGVPRIN